MVHDGDAIAQLVGFVHIMSGQQDGQVALLFQFHEHFPDRNAGDGIEARRGLVEKEDLRLVDETAGDFEPPAHAAGEELHGLIGPMS